MTVLRRRGFASRQVRIVIASVFALAGVSWGVWTLYGTFKPREYNRTFRVRTPGGGPGGGGGSPMAGGGQAVEREVAVPMGGEALAGLLGGQFEPEPEEYVWTDVRNDSDVPRVMEEFQRELTATLDGVEELKPLGMARRDQVAQAARMSLEPLVLNDPEGFKDAMRNLGGVTDSISDEAQASRADALYGQLASLLEHASFDLTNMRASRPDRDAGGWMGDAFPTGPDGAAVGATISVTEDVDEDVGGDRGQSVRMMTQTVSTGHLFPEVADWRSTDKRAVEYSVPAKKKGSKGDGADFRLGTIMVWNESAGAWQPAEYKLKMFNLEGMKLRMGSPSRGGR